MRLIDNGERINVISDNRITFKDIKEDKIIKNNLIAIQRTQIIQVVKDVNKKYGRKLTKLEHQQLMKKISNKIGRKLTSSDRDLINERLIGGQKREDKNQDIKTKGGIIYRYKEGIGMARILEGD